jgi:hypothetical protein
MTKLNYNRPNSGYEMEPWDRRRFQNTQRSAGINKTLHEESVFISGKYFARKIGQVIKADKIDDAIKLDKCGHYLSLEAWEKIEYTLEKGETEKFKKCPLCRAGHNHNDYE